MYKIYSKNNRITLEDDGLIIYQQLADNSMVQLINGEFYLYDAVDHLNSIEQSFYKLGPISNIIGDASISFSSTNSFYNYFGDITSQEKDLGTNPMIVIGSALTSIKPSYAAYGCSCRVEGSTIASLQKTINDVESVDDDEDIVGVPMYKGEWFPFINPVTKVTQTGSTDSIVYYLKLL